MTRFTPHILDEIRARLPCSQVVGRKVALKKAGREYKGLSPFKVEKTPSFTVNDQKGFYHCFATGEHGDIFTFVMKTEGLDFPEAVERLAEEAGVPLPMEEPRERAAGMEEQRDRLYRLLEASARYFEACLKGQPGAQARLYLEKRGLAHDTIAEFRLGYAPNARQALHEHLRKEGFTSADIAVAGMLIAGADIAEPYDRFRHRVMFPITDMKGRVIAFGGRALEKDVPAKYLNSPETPLFHKGANLYNGARARPLAHDKERIIVVEGYMDVVALCEGGFGESVAPLGTALTEDQVKLLWRMCEVPTLCFDGDSAGKKAAYRAVDTALPHLKPGKSVQFAFLPDGLDPDDLIRQQGVKAMGDALARSKPLIEVLWERETSAHQQATPEQRAALQAKLQMLVNSISDQLVRAHYDREIRNRLFALGRVTMPARQGAGKDGRTGAAQQLDDWKRRERARLFGERLTKVPPRSALPHLPSSELASLTHAAPQREALILKAILNHPWLIDDHAEQLAELSFAATALSALRDEILNLHAVQNSLDSATLRTQLSKTGVSKVVDLVERTITHRSDRFAEPEASATDVETGWRHVLALHQRQDGLERSLKAAEEAWYRDCTPEAEARLLDLKRQLAQLSSLEHLDSTELIDLPPETAAKQAS